MPELELARFNRSALLSDLEALSYRPKPLSPKARARAQKSSQRSQRLRRAQLPLNRRIPLRSMNGLSLPLRSSLPRSPT